MKCRDCVNYEEIDEQNGSCFGIIVDGDRDPQDSEKCQGKFYEPKEGLN